MLFKKGGEAWSTTLKAARLRQQQAFSKIEVIGDHVGSGFGGRMETEASVVHNPSSWLESPDFPGERLGVVC